VTFILIFILKIKMNDLNFEEVKNRIEAILFSYGDWISVSELMDSLDIDSEILVRNAMEELLPKFLSGYSFLIEEREGKYRMTLHSQYDQVVTSLISGTEIPRNVLKVLSVIAYEQPITKTRLSEILGKYVKNEVDYLYKAKFTSYEKKGIGKYYKVTKKFYDYFKIEEDDFRAAANKNINIHLEDPAPMKPEVRENNLDKDSDDSKNSSESDSLDNSDFVVDENDLDEGLEKPPKLN
jgi:segregation and condensation protein B